MKIEKEVLEKNKFYPLADRFPLIPLSRQRFLRGRWTGEKRPPRKNEWYFSGNPIEVWKAPNDLTTPYHIAEILEVEIVTKEIEVRNLTVLQKTMEPKDLVCVLSNIFLDNAEKEPTL